MQKNKCSLTRYLQIVPGDRSHYNRLSHFHYCNDSLNPYAAIYAITDAHPVRSRFAGVVGVIVYTTPAPNLALRNHATGGIFTGFTDRRLQLQTVNKNIRCISRVIIEPRYRSLGLAPWLVEKTMPRLDFPIIESLAVMGNINPFFEKAGMKAFSAPQCLRNAKLIEALSIVGIDEDMFIDAAAVWRKLNSLDKQRKSFIDRQFGIFLQSFGKRRFMEDSLDRTRYVLGKLTFRPVYYIWNNPNKLLKGV